QMTNSSVQTKRPTRYVLLYSAVTAVLVGLLLRSVDSEKLVAAFQNSHIGLFSLATLCGIGQSCFMARRWQLMMRKDGIVTPYWPVLVSYTESMFFSLFLPSAVGGDLYRGAKANRDYKSAARTATGLLVERLVGIWGVCLLGVIGLVMGNPSPEVRSAFFILLFGVVGACVAIFWGGKGISRLLDRLGLDGLAVKISMLASQSRGYFSSLRLFTRLVLYSMIAQLLGVTSIYLVGCSLDIELSYFFYLTTMPLVWVLSLMPALGGLGPREAGLFFALTSADVGPAPAVAVGVLLYATMLLRGLFGGLLFAARKIILT
ncbi:MAG: flippase-like domain-containing protein, partial [Polyangiaceae bacterium]|nr:flippase-like domain-containing protein [Polyangiaceae bacterium]